jgi:hypothetical protein
MKTNRAFAIALCSLLTTAMVPAGETNLSGQYAGTVTDSNLGSGTAVANFIMDPQGGIGGWLGFTLGSTTYDDPASSNVNGNTVKGIFEETVGGNACTFNFRATFDRARHTLRGKYYAAYSADGTCYEQSGKFVLKQQCYYNGNGQDIRPAGGPMHC